MASNTVYTKTRKTKEKIKTKFTFYSIKMHQKYTSIEQYIQTFPKDTQKKLQEIRNIIKKEVPHAIEKISYQIPTFFLNGNLVHFAGYAKHIGFYPTSSGISAFEKEIGQYAYSKGSIQFPLEEELPTALIKKIVKYRVKENTQKKDFINSTPR